MVVVVVVVGLPIEVAAAGTGFPVEEEVAGMVDFRITGVIGFPVVLTVGEVTGETGGERDGEKIRS